MAKLALIISTLISIFTFLGQAQASEIPFMGYEAFDSTYDRFMTYDKKTHQEEFNFLAKRIIKKNNCAALELDRANQVMKSPELEVALVGAENINPGFRIIISNFGTSIFFGSEDNQYYQLSYDRENCSLKTIDQVVAEIKRDLNPNEKELTSQLNVGLEELLTLSTESPQEESNLEVAAHGRDDQELAYFVDGTNRALISTYQK